MPDNEERHVRLLECRLIELLRVGRALHKNPHPNSWDGMGGSVLCRCLFIEAVV